MKYTKVVLHQTSFGGAGTDSPVAQIGLQLDSQWCLWAPGVLTSTYLPSVGMASVCHPANLCQTFLIFICWPIGFLLLGEGGCVSLLCKYCVCVPVPSKARRRCLLPWSWRYRYQPHDVGARSWTPMSSAKWTSSPHLLPAFECYQKLIRCELMANNC